MRKKLKRILLIDDDQPTNFFHEMVIRKANCVEEVVSVQTGHAALEFLQSSVNGEHPQPELIFLDINMPAMNGWEFLDHYKKLPEIQKGRIVVVMLTTSLNPDDADKAKDIPEINGFKSKPLTDAMLAEVLETYFEKYPEEV